MKKLLFIFAFLSISFNASSYCILFYHCGGNGASVCGHVCWNHQCADLDLADIVFACCDDCRTVTINESYEIAMTATNDLILTNKEDSVILLTQEYIESVDSCAISIEWSSQTSFTLIVQSADGTNDYPYIEKYTVISSNAYSAYELLSGARKGKTLDVEIKYFGDNIIINNYNSTNYYYYIYNIDGRIVNSGLIKENNSIINTSQYEKGMYIISLYNNKEGIIQKKFVLL